MVLQEPGSLQHAVALLDVLVANDQVLEDLEDVVSVGCVDDGGDEAVAFAEWIDRHGHFEAAGAHEAEDGESGEVEALAEDGACVAEAGWEGGEAAGAGRL